jgi:hypothetical protein
MNPNWKRRVAADKESRELHYIMLLFIANQRGIGVIFSRKFASGETGGDHSMPELYALKKQLER